MMMRCNGCSCREFFFSLVKHRLDIIVPEETETDTNANYSNTVKRFINYAGRYALRSTREGDLFRPDGVSYISIFTLNWRMIRKINHNISFHKKSLIRIV